MSSAFSGRRQMMQSPFSQIGVDPFGYSAGGTFMGGGMGGYGGGFGGGFPSYGMGGGYGMPSFSNPFSGGGGFGFGSGIGGFGTSFGGMGMGGGSQGYQFPVPPQPSVNDLFGQYMMNQYYGGGAFNPYQQQGFGGGAFGGFMPRMPRNMPSFFNPMNPTMNAPAELAQSDQQQPQSFNAQDLLNQRMQSIAQRFMF